MASNHTQNGGESDPYVDMEPTFEKSMDIVERETVNSDDQVSLKKIFTLLFIFLIIILGGLSGVYYIFYGNPTNTVADGWNPTHVIPSSVEPQKTQNSDAVPLTTIADSVALTHSSLASIPLTISSHATQLTISKAQPSISIANNSQTHTADVMIQQLTVNASNDQTAMDVSSMLTRTTAINDLEPITPNLRITPVLYRSKIVDESKKLTEDKGDTETAIEDSDELTETKDKASIADASSSITKSEKKDGDKSEKTMAQLSTPLSQRRKPIVFRASIPLILMYPELTLNFNSFLVLLPDTPSNTFVNIDVSLKTSNEAVFKEIQDRKTFVRGAIFGILKRMFESVPMNTITNETIKNRIVKDINYVLINGTVDKVYITNFLTI
ncbi:hypothetical protein MHK_006322 [Candidatus Magnetomorum sp. HK-1]|nr:hypothetical protein MHK_006322 [Candidatus Magnetomorum sp. HK-1]